MRNETVTFSTIDVDNDLAATALLLKLGKAGRKKTRKETLDALIVAGLVGSKQWNTEQVRGIQERAEAQDRGFFKLLGMALSKGRSGGVLSLVEHFLLMHWRECPGGLPGLESWKPSAVCSLLKSEGLHDWPEPEKEFRRVRDGLGLKSKQPYLVTDYSRDKRGHRVVYRD